MLRVLRSGAVSASELDGTSGGVPGDQHARHPRGQSPRLVPRRTTELFGTRRRRSAASGATSTSFIGSREKRRLHRRTRHLGADAAGARHRSAQTTPPPAEHCGRHRWWCPPNTLAITKR
jgi:hypothetical protein